jgi:hypothetical protein
MQKRLVLACLSFCGIELFTDFLDLVYIGEQPRLCKMNARKHKARKAHECKDLSIEH